MPILRELARREEGHKKKGGGAAAAFFVFGYTANCIRTVPAQLGQSSFIDNRIPRACS